MNNVKPLIPKKAIFSKSKAIVYLSLMLCIFLQPISEAEHSVELKINDTNGNPVPSFEVLAIYNYPREEWTQGVNGKIFLQKSDALSFLNHRELTRYEILIRAEGYAPNIVPIDYKPEKVKHKVTLTPSHEVHVRILSSSNIPISKNLIPVSYFKKHAFLIRTAHQKNPNSDFKLFNVKDLGGGNYSFRIPENSKDIYCFLNNLDIIHSYVIGPFTASETTQEPIDIQLPKTSSISMTFHPPLLASDKQPYASVSISVLRFLPDNEGGLERIMTESSETPSLSFTIDTLPPGKYWITGTTRPDKGVNLQKIERPNPSLFRELYIMHIKEGENKTIDFHYKPLDTEIVRGKHSANFHLKRYDGSAAGDINYVFTYNHPNYGDIIVQEGKTSESGMIQLSNITAKPMDQNQSLQDEYDERPQYLLTLENRKLGAYPIKVTKEKLHHDFEFTLPPDVGDTPPDIAFTKLFLDKESRISDYRDKVVFLEFWASWCGPCQGPMA